MAYQSFQLKVMVQGVAGYVPHDNGESLLALFPDQDRAKERGVRTFDDEEICRHYAVAQFDLRSLRPTAPESWASVDLTGHWVKVSSDSAIRLDLSGQSVPGLPRLDEVLSAAGVAGEFAAIDGRALPGGRFDPSLLKAGLVMDRGFAGPANPWTGPFDFYRGSLGHDRQIDVGDRYANVIEFELGDVTNCELALKPFAGGPERRIELRPIGIEDQLTVWIRHFCDTDKPDSNRFRPNALDPDTDFALAYALSSDLAGLIRKSGGMLPFPRVAKSYAGGLGVGGNPNKCMGAQYRSETFQSPF